MLHLVGLSTHLKMMHGSSNVKLPCHRLEIHINLAVKEIGWENMNRTHLAQDWDKW